MDPKVGAFLSALQRTLLTGMTQIARVVNNELVSAVVSTTGTGTVVSPVVGGISNGTLTLAGLRASGATTITLQGDNTILIHS